MSPCPSRGHLTGEVKKHEWTGAELKELITWERTCIEPKPENLSVYRKIPLISQQDMLSKFSSELGQYQAMRWLKPTCILFSYSFLAH